RRADHAVLAGGRRRPAAPLAAPRALRGLRRGRGAGRHRLHHLGGARLMPSAEFKRWIVAILGLLFLGSLVVVAYREARTERRAGERPRPVVPHDSKECV